MVSWMKQTNETALCLRVLGPVTLIRVNIDQADLAIRCIHSLNFFDMVNTELSVAFSPLRGISAGQYLELRAPQGFAFLERSFRFPSHFSSLP